MRVVIVDFNHMVHTYWNSDFRLSIRTVDEFGNPYEKDTTVHSGTIKCVNRWSKGGVYPTAVCFDRPVPARKAFFQSNFDMPIGTDKEYKGGREKMPDAMFKAISEVESIFRAAGVSCFAEIGYEADDLVFACVQRAKEKYPGIKIDVITNDADLLPLVDDTVSVFIRSKKGTYAVTKDLEKPHYIQVTPDNFSLIVEDLSAYRGFRLPYNSILLHKLLRGDASDKFGRKDISRAFSPKKWNAFIDLMEENDVNFEEIFRYGKPVYKLLYKDTGEEFKGTIEEAKASPDRARLCQKVVNTEELDCILWCLRNFSELSEEQVEAVEKIYWGMNLNQPYPNKNRDFARPEYKLAEKGHGDIGTYNEIELQKLVSSLQINLGVSRS